MLGSSPIVRLRARVSPRAASALLVGVSALGIACSEGRLPTGPGGFAPMPAYVRLNATVGNTGRAMKVVARYATRTDTLKLTPFDSTTLSLTGVETQLPVQLDLARCLGAGDRELPAGLPAEQTASVCVLRLVVTLLDANNVIIDQSALAPIVARPGEESQAPPVSLGIPVGKVTVSPKLGTINALTRTLDLAAAVVDRNNTAIVSPALSFSALDAAVATVDTATGRVTARAVGTARIVVSSRDKADTAIIVVRQVPKTVTLTAPVTSLIAGDSVQVTAVTQDSANVTIPTTAAPVQFSSSDTSVAVVSGAGRVTTKRVGTATITGINGPASGTLSLTVTPVPVSTVTVTPNPDTVGIGMSSQLVATLRGASGATLTGRGITWASADTLKAKVDTLGLVFGVNVGTTSITATSEGKSATATVVIEPALFCPSGAPRSDATLQASIARTPVNGTVYVCDGTFTVDSVSVNKALTLRSQHPAGATLVEGDPNVTAIQTGRPALYVNGIASGKVRIVDLGFRMKGRGITLTGTYDQVVIDSSRFYGVDSTTSIPISVSVSSVPAAHVDITNSQFDHFGIGVFLVSTTETFVRRNLFQNFNGGGVLFSSSGQAGSNYSTGRVEDNTFRSCGARNCVRGLLIGPNAVIARNRMEIPGGANGLPAIFVQRALQTPSRNPMIIEDNVIVGAATGGDPQTAAGWTVQAGISVNDSIGVENVVRRNTVSGAHTGIIMLADGRSTDNVVSSGAYAFNVTGSLITAYFQRNDFTGLVNSFVSNSTRGSYQCNWWGSVNGPAVTPAGVPANMYVPVATQPIANQPGVACNPTTFTSTLSGIVLAGATGDPLPGATVEVLRGTTLVGSATSGADGRYTVSALPDGAGSVRFSAPTWVTATIDSIVIAGATTADPAPLAATSQSPGVITGTALDATTNEPTSAPVTLELRTGIGSTSGTVLQTVQADSATGTYTFAPTAAGTYTVLARATGYTAARRTVVATGGTTSDDQRIVLSPTAPAGAVRIVLTWGDTPPDLDSHLIGPDSAGNPFHVFYGDQGDCSVNPFACLDVDATNGFGPETITLTRQNAGTYRFMVNNYTVAGDSAAATDESLSRSGGRVDLYINNALARTFNVPAGQGTLWTVFELDGSTITPINTISADAPPEVGGTTPNAVRRQQDRARLLRDVRNHPKGVRTR